MNPLRLSAEPKVIPLPETRGRSSGCSFRATASFFLIVLVLLPNAKADDKIHCITKIAKNRITYRTYTIDGDTEVDASDLDIPDPELAQKVASGLSGAKPDFKHELLLKGGARLRNASTAPRAYVEAEQTARTSQLGLWAPSGGAASDGSEWSLWSILKTMAGFGILGWIGQALWRAIFARKRVALVLLGEPSAGKTGFRKRLIDPFLPSSQILSLSPSANVVQQNHECIERKDCVIFPRIMDIPGAHYGTVFDTFLPLFAFANNWFPKSAFWDALLFRTIKVAVIVVAPTKGRVAVNGSAVDRDYLLVQEGCVRTYVAGITGAQRTHKPRLIVLFINKFDLLSQHQPDTVDGRPHYQTMIDLFKNHIDSVQAAADKADIGVRVLVGSAVHGWSCPEVLNSTVNALYGRA